MKFKLTANLSFDLSDKLKVISVLSDYLEEQFSKIDFGKGLEFFFIEVNSINPEMLTPQRDFETGFLLRKKYTKSKETIEISIKLNYGEVSKADDNEKFISILSNALALTQPDVESIPAKKFRVKEFYSALQTLLSNYDYRTSTTKEFIYKLPEGQTKSQFSQDKMPENDFWDLVSKSKDYSQGHLYEQIEIITQQLTDKSKEEIFGFELTLRSLIIRAYNYNVMAVQKIVEGSVTDDSFLYFRCKLILYGKVTFEAAIENPNLIVEKISRELSGEGLLAVADNAFVRKFGESNIATLPREQAAELIDYDFGRYELQGKEWNEKDIYTKYNQLVEMYQE